ncbi:DNA repair protein rad51d [Linnemannia hyalina]|uniref:DNA repair protein rad51d n=1 Tax=Linnemannia hyalina TaxID=64524 RepID=A0A9P8BUH7_9FUNG|nr:DNA repair protein rad51d [Linnemannia hyalina]
MMCLNSMIAMLVQDESSQAVWIETVDYEFSAQRASDTAKAFILSRKDQQQEPQESGEGGLVLEAHVKNVLSRIQVYSCQDVYDVLNAIEMFRSTQRRPDPPRSHRLSPRLFVVDSLSAVLTNLLRMGDGVGHATMMHLSRELRQVASDFDLVVLVTTLPVQISFSEEKAPSILMTSNVKPGLGSSWKYATDLQVFLSRFEMTDGGGNGTIKPSRDGYSRHPSRNEVDVDMSAEISADETMDVNAETRIVEVIKSKRLTTGEWCLFQLKD